MSGATADARALLQTENESLAKQLDALTGGTSTYDAATGLWNLSASQQGALDRYRDARDDVANSAYMGYRPETDTAYQSLKKAYLREGDRATENALGTYAGMTGGYASTAAISAAMQAGDNCRTQLADRQADLAAQDYNRYQNDLANRRALMQLYGSEAEQSAQALANNGDFSGLQLMYGWSDAQRQAAEADWAEKKRIEEEERTLPLRQASAQQLAALGDFAAMQELYGWTDAQRQMAEKAWAQEQALALAGGSGGGGRRRSSGGSSKSSGLTVDGMTEDEIFDIVANLATWSPNISVGGTSLAKGLLQNQGLTQNQLAVANQLMDAVLPASSSKTLLEYAKDPATAARVRAQSSLQQRARQQTTAAAARNLATKKKNSTTGLKRQTK